VCTVSIVTWAGGLRLVANRDEQRSRADALPPRLVERNGVHSIQPIDAASGGTWVAVNEFGVAFALLNVNPATPFQAGTHSRGEIIAALAALDSIEDVVEAMKAVDHAQYSPFRLICAAGEVAVEIAPYLSLRRQHALDSPVMFTSSGLGDDRVEGPRRRLFDELVGVTDAGGRKTIDRQDSFHAHRWSDAPHLSVFMSRDDACTVSRTVIEVRERGVAMTYAGRPDWESRTLRMPRAGAG